MHKPRCTLKRIALLYYIYVKSGVYIQDLDEVVGKIVKSKASLYEMLRHIMRQGLVSIDAYGRVKITEAGLEYIEMCKERGILVQSLQTSTAPSVTSADMRMY